MLHGPLAHHGYDWWWHSFTAQDAETGEDKPFFIEFFTEQRGQRLNIGRRWNSTYYTWPLAICLTRQDKYIGWFVQPMMRNVPAPVSAQGMG